MHMHIWINKYVYKCDVCIYIWTICTYSWAKIIRQGPYHGHDTKTMMEPSTVSLGKPPASSALHAAAAPTAEAPPGPRGKTELVA